MSIPNDFLSLSNEAKKRFPEIKEASEKALLILRSGKDGQYDDSQSSEIASPLLLAIDSRNAKLILIAVNTLHRLLIQKIISLNDALKVSSKMDILVQQNQDIQLKTLQISLSIASLYPIRIDEICNNLKICHNLMDSKTPVVSNTAMATFRQVLTSTFERGIANMDSQILEKDMEPLSDKGVEYSVHFSVLDSYLLFLDLCLRANGEAPYHLKVETISKNTFLEIIDSVLLSHASLFQRNPPLISLLRDKLCPMLLKKHNEKLEYSATLRLFRIMQRVIEKFSSVLEMEAEIFLNLFLKTMSNPPNKWARILSLEIICDLSGDITLMRMLFKKFDMKENSVRVLSDMIKAFCKVEVCEEVVENENRPSCLSSLDRTELPVLSNSYKNFISIDAFLNLVSSWSRLALKEFNGTYDWDNDDPLIIVKPLTSRLNVEDAVEMFAKNWDLYTNGLDLILNNYKLSPELWKRFFKTIRDSILAVSILGRKELVDSGIRVLYACVFPPSIDLKPNADINAVSKSIGEREILAFEILSILSINLIGTNDVPWTLLYDSMTFYEFLMRALPKNGIHFGFDTDLTNNPLENCSLISQKVLESGDKDSFKNFCKGFSDACTFLLKSGGKLVFYRQILKEDDVIILQKLLIFAKSFNTKLRLPSNEESWTCLWSCLIESLNSNNIDAIVKGQVSLNLCNLVWEFLNGIEGKTLEKDEYVQKSFIKPIKELSKIPFSECQISSLELLNKILNSYGQSLRFIWSEILEIIHLSLSSSERWEIRVSFPSLQLICTDYLSFLPPSCIETCSDVLHHFCRQSEDINISLTSVGLMWNIAYHLREERSKDPEFEDNYNILFKALLRNFSALSADPRSEVRNSVIQTMIRAINFNASVLSAIQWKYSLVEVLFPIFPILTAKSSKENAPAGLSGHDLKQWLKQWDESKGNLVGGVGKIFVDGLKKLIGLGLLEELWSAYLTICLDMALVQSNEVCIAIFKAIKSVISAKPFSVAENEKSQKISYGKWKETVRRITTEKVGVNQETFLHLSGCFSDLHSFGSVNVNETELRFCFARFRDMVTYSFVGEIIGDVENTTALQQSILDHLELIKTNGRPEQACFKIEILCDFASLAFLINEKKMIPEESGSGSNKRNLSQSSFISLSKKAFEKVSLALKDAATGNASISSGIFKKVINTLAVPMALKYKCPVTGKGPSLWKLAVEYFELILEVSLPFLKLQYETPSIITDAWSSIIEACRGFICAESFNGNIGISLEDLEADEQVELKFLDFLEHKILKNITHPAVNEPKLRELFEAIEAGSKLYEEQASLDTSKNQVIAFTSVSSAMPSINVREKFAATCLNLLFSICNVGKGFNNGNSDNNNKSEHIAVAEICIPVLLKRCDSVLKRYSEEKPLHGRFPLSRVRTVEISFILNQLADLELPTGLIGHLLTDRLRSNACNSSKAHLFYLYQSLCGCLRTDDAAIMSLIQKCLMQIGSEMGMDSADGI